MLPVYKNVGECIETQRKDFKIQTNQYLTTGEMPVIDQGADFIGRYIDDPAKAYTGPLPVIVFGDHTCCLKYVSVRFAVGADGTQLIRPNSDFDVRYFYYALRAQKMEHFGYQRHFKLLKTKDVAWFPLPTQQKIAAILSAYDDLIENNLGRIKILEAMAQNLYREWFVLFRFPGHQNARFTDSPLGRIPEGWEVREMQEIAEVIDCLHSKKPQHDEAGTGLLLQLCNIGEGGKTDLSDKFLITDDDYRKWTSRIEVQAGDCVITNVGRVGAVAQIPRGLKAAIGRNMTAVRPFAVGPTYLIEGG